MARNTPEGKVKKQLLKILDDLGGDCFYYMPVQNGMGQTGIPDVMAIIKGVPFAFEVKATPKQHPTTRQAFALERIHNACGYAWVVDDESIQQAKLFLDEAVALLSGKIKRTIATKDELQYLETSEQFRVLYRWRKQLEVMEFGDG